MSNIYIQEPPTTGKVVLKTSIGDLELELWTKEAPKACRNFIQLCMEGYYENTIFHRLVKGFIVQGGDPTGTGEGGESVYGHPFKDEFHTRLRFCRRGLLAMANAGKDDNGSQFFFTLAATPELQNKHTIFGKVTGETIYNMLKLEEALVDENERPSYPQKILKTEVITNPFKDIVPRDLGKSAIEEKKSEKPAKKSGVKNFKLLSFGEEAEEDEEETVVLNKKFVGKSKSAHDNLSDPKLSSEIEPLKMPNRDENSASDKETKEQTREITDRIKNKLSAKRRKPNDDRSSANEAPKNEEDEEEEYYLGKDRIEGRRKEAEAIRKEIRELKRGVRDETRAKEKRTEETAQKEDKTKKEYMKEYIETREKYDEAKTKVPKKGKSREELTLSLLKKFRGKLASAKEEATTGGLSSEEASEARSKSREKLGGSKMDDENDDGNDGSWFAHSLQCDEKDAVLAKDASTKDDDWFEITDPRNPLNKRRRGETQSSHRGRHK
ncbi:spliceosome-associated protein CWC27 homolog [Venturia canescens]|uniref:spliceosome-associated protein CWC27 homolog n=1 Tax=Venturia canescens TaxID=32260 RepID=UPI001C9CA431|nr:spliceosome-associated protein CWC27 homolog [Venturia canescens]